jgi:hypothetical protein
VLESLSEFFFMMTQFLSHLWFMLSYDTLSLPACQKGLQNDFLEILKYNNISVFAHYIAIVSACVSLYVRYLNKRRTKAY